MLDPVYCEDGHVYDRASVEKAQAIQGVNVRGNAGMPIGKILGAVYPLRKIIQKSHPEVIKKKQLAKIAESLKALDLKDVKAFAVENKGTILDLWEAYDPHPDKEVAKRLQHAVFVLLGMHTEFVISRLDAGSGSGSNYEKAEKLLLRLRIKDSSEYRPTPDVELAVCAYIQKQRLLPICELLLIIFSLAKGCTEASNWCTYITTTRLKAAAMDFLFFNALQSIQVADGTGCRRILLLWKHSGEHYTAKYQTVFSEFLQTDRVITSIARGMSHVTFLALRDVARYNDSARLLFMKVNDSGWFQSVVRDEYW